MLKRFISKRVENIKGHDQIRNHYLWIIYMNIYYILYIIPIITVCGSLKEDSQQPVPGSPKRGPWDEDPKNPLIVSALKN
jgi:hypothetical protein